MWHGAARLIGRYNTLVSVLGAALAIYVGALRSAGAIADAPPASAMAGAPTRPLLRVCADPAELPHSRDRLDHFQSALASLVVGDLDAEASYTWWVRRGGLVRDTRNADACDVSIGVPGALEGVLTTRRYHRSTRVSEHRPGPAVN